MFGILASDSMLSQCIWPAKFEIAIDGAPAHKRLNQMRILQGATLVKGMAKALREAVSNDPVAGGNGLCNTCRQSTKDG